MACPGPPSATETRVDALLASRFLRPATRARLAELRADLAEARAERDAALAELEHLRRGSGWGRARGPVHRRPGGR